MSFSKFRSSDNEEEEEEEESVADSETSADMDRLVVNEAENGDEVDGVNETETEALSGRGKTGLTHIPVPQYVLADSPLRPGSEVSEETRIPTPQYIINQTLPLVSELNDDATSNDTDDLSVASSGGFSSVPNAQHQLQTPQNTPPKSMTKPPYKGVMVPCGQLKDYLDSMPTFNRKCMLRKGREVHKIYVDMTKGETFLDDQFAYTEFGRMVLTNGSIRAGRAKNAKQIVVARETLYCSGTTACKRACGGYGICLPGELHVNFLN